MITKTIIWRRPDGGISITYYDDSDDYDQIVAKHVSGDILKVEDGVSKVPHSREHRDCWDLSNDKVEVDPDKLQAKLDKISQDEFKKQAILSKLKLSESELKDLING